jgi:hypothetical protein
MILGLLSFVYLEIVISFHCGGSLSFVNSRVLRLLLLRSNDLVTLQDSPVFNYINNLSPIELVKSIHTVQAFNLPSFASPFSVFASPQLSSQRDTRSFTRR